MKSLCIALVALGLAACAANPPPTIPPASTVTDEPPVAVGQEVWVTRIDRTEVHGAVSDVSTEEVAVVSEGAVVSIPVRMVAKIEVSGGKATGRYALRGGAIGAGAMALAVLVSMESCDGAIVCLDGPGFVLAGAVFGAAIGAGVGALIGSNVRKRVVVYPRPRDSKGLLLLPSVNANRLGFIGVVRW